MVAGLVVVLVGAGIGTYAVVHRPAAGAPVEVDLTSGLTTAGIAGKLHASDVIGSEIGFRVLVKARGLDGRLQAGRYELRRGMGVQAAIDALAVGPKEKTSTVTIPEGYTVKQIAAKVGQRTKVSEQAFTAAVTAGGAHSAIQPPATKSLEGFLFPETYVVSERETADQLLARMVRTFDERTQPLDWSAATSRGLSQYQAIVVASLVEREAKVPEDRPKVAAVIYNRLAKGMLLQIDATVLYDLPQHKVPTKKDLERESPYNTYLHAGLPPTPIANPGIDAIRAALDPAPIKALYYVVIDPSGRHGFAETYAEFEQMKKLRPPETRGGSSN